MESWSACLTECRGRVFLREASTVNPYEMGRWCQRLPRMECCLVDRLMNVCVTMKNGSGNLVASYQDGVFMIHQSDGMETDPTSPYPSNWKTVTAMFSWSMTIIKDGFGVEKRCWQTHWGFCQHGVLRRVKNDDCGARIQSCSVSLASCSRV